MEARRHLRVMIFPRAAARLQRCVPARPPFHVHEPGADPLGKGYPGHAVADRPRPQAAARPRIATAVRNSSSPEPPHDFIFSIIARGARLRRRHSALIGLFRVSGLARLPDHALQSAPLRLLRRAWLTLLIGIQSLINVSVALCLLPTKGLRCRSSVRRSSLIRVSCGRRLLNLSQQSG